MDEQRRTLLAIALIIGFLFVWFEYFVPKPQPKPQHTQSAASPSPEALPAKGPSEAAANTPEPSVKKKPEEFFSFESHLWNVRFSSTTASPASVTLSKFRSAATKNASPVRVVPFMGEAPSMHWIYEINNREISDRELDFQAVKLDPGHVVFESLPLDGTIVRKTYEWNQDQYAMVHALQIRNARAEPIRAQPRFVLPSGVTESKAQTMFNPGDPLHAVMYVNEKSARFSKDDLTEGKELPKGEILWTGFDSRYFMVAAMPEEGKWQDVSAGSEGAPNKDDEGVSSVHATMTYPPADVLPGGTLAYRMNLYMGPKDIEILSAQGHEMDRAIDLGDWLGPIARPILFFLRWLHEHIGNYGLAIILLTVLVRLLMFPLTQMQARSMKKMQDHKPQMDALREKYGENKEQYSRELMNYMRTHRINPMGGCLLILPQVPIFMALYRVLYNSIELRHAPFFLWIHDLSARDPYFVTPIILGALMFVQQSLTPMAGVDPKQQSIMKMMPVMFAGLMLFLPAGLNLYILVSTAWGIGQQYLIKRGGGKGSATPQSLKNAAMA